MRAMVLESPGAIRSDGPGAPLRAITRDDDQPGEGQLALRVAACGVCRTDLQLCEGDLEPRSLPVVPGHQIVGRVEAIGPGVTGWRVGDRAGVGWLARACGQCAECTRGRENLCQRARFTGWDGDGGYATRALADARFTFALPEGFSDLAAAPLLCGGVIGYRSLRVSGIEPGGRLGLFGFGASALLAMQVALHWRCQVYVCTRSSREQERAREMGAAWAGGYDQHPPVALDAAITFAPAGEVVVAALRSLGRGGVVAINAIHLDRVPQLDYRDLWWERSLRSVSNYTRRDAEEFLALAATIPVRTAFETHPLESANLALARLRDGLVDGAAVLVMDA